MQIGVLGLSHRTAPVELRERLYFQTEKLPHALGTVREELGVSECVILSTCNRVELYALFSNGQAEASSLKQFLARFHGLDLQELSPRLYWHLQPDSVRHLFRVASGLDSMVLGESEILGQVREAYLQAVSCGSVGKVFHRLFQTALRTGKEVRSKTRIGQGATSVSSVAVELARRIFQNVRTKTILTLGTGAMGQTTLQCLKEQGIAQVLVANRTYSKAESLAREVGGEALPFDELIRGLAQADIVLCSTGASEHLLAPAQIRQVMALRRQRPLFIIDISVPRNVDPQVGSLENVYLYNIDDLEGIASTNLQLRLKEVASGAAIIEAQLEDFMGRALQGADLERRAEAL